MKVSLLFGLLLASASVQAQTTFTVDGTQYKVTGSNTVELVKGDTKATEVVIPASVTYNGKEYAVKNMRYYSLYRICNLAIKMKEEEDIKDDSKVLSALCTDLDAMCEIVAIILCNHLFTSDGNRLETFGEVKTRNAKMIDVMKARVMQSTFDTGQWAAIIIGAIKSIDLSGFFLLKKSVSVLTDSLMERKMKAVETASQFMEAQSLVTQAIS